MRILHVIPSVSLKRGGPSHALFSMVRAVRELGAESEIAATSDDDGGTLDVPLCRRVEYRGVPAVFFRPTRLLTRNFLFSAGLKRWLGRHLGEYDVLHAHYLFSHASACACAVARSRGIPYLLRTVGQLNPKALRRGRLRKAVYAFCVERRNLDAAAAVHCAGEAEAADVRAFGIKSPLAVVPPGVEQPVRNPEARPAMRRRFSVPEGAPVVLFLSRMHPYKRPDLLIGAFRRMPLREKECYAVFAGGGDREYRRHLEALAGSLGLASRVRFTGFVTGPDKDLLLQGSDIFALTSVSENFGVALVEAMAAGLPAVMTRGVQMSAEAEGCGAGLAVDDREEAIAGAIASLLDSPALRDRMGEEGRRLVSRRYTCRRMGEKLMEWYASAAAGRLKSASKGVRP